jgi:hypothetical protein
MTATLLPVKSLHKVFADVVSGHGTNWHMSSESATYMRNGRLQSLKSSLLIT